MTSNVRWSAIHSICFTLTPPGCISPPNQAKPISFRFSCANSSSANVDYFSGSECMGAVVHTAHLPIDTTCTAESGGASSQSTCTFGEYRPSPTAINVNVFTNAQNKCPVAPGEHATGIVEIAYHQCITFGTTSSYWYGCSSIDVTGESFTSADCSGAPHDAPVIPLGCYANTTNPAGIPQFTTCPQHAAAVPAKQLRAVRTTVSSAPAVQFANAAINAAVAAETARALAVLA